MTPPQRKKVIATSAPRIIDLPSKVDGDQLSLSLEIIDYATCSYNVVENEAHFVLNVSIREKFQSLFEKVVFGILKSFFQVDHQVEINFYVADAKLLYSATVRN